METDAAGKFVEAILRLARINDCEPGCHRNPKEAFRWYKTAANLRSPYAQYCVATCYANGFGVLKDDVEAFGWFLKSALQKPPGFSCAQHAVGVRFRDGKGAPKDDCQAVRWFRKAADLGLAVAQYDLANAYRLGKGTPKDFEAAVEWYENAA